MKRMEFLRRLSLGFFTVFSFESLFFPSKYGSGKTFQVDLKSSLVNLGDPSIILNGEVLVFRISIGNTPSSFIATEAIHASAYPSLFGKPIKKESNNQNSQNGRTDGTLRVFPITINGTLLSIFIS